MSTGARHICDKLSDWECVELYLSFRMGTAKKALCGRYTVSKRTLNQIIDRIEATAHGLGLSTRRMKGF